MIRLSSLDDPRATLYRSVGDPDALLRAGVFVAEGRMVVRRLLAAPRWTPHSLLLTDTALAAAPDLVAAAAVRGTPLYAVDQQTMNAIAGFNIHRGCLALAERPPARGLDTLALDRLTRLVVLEGVNNPDNIGGIFRSAAAFGVDAVVLGPACSDPLYRKAVRTSMAATLAVPFAVAGAWPDALTTLRAHGLAIIALTPAADARAIDDVPRDLARAALLVGAEGDGLSAAALAAADVHVRIPMASTVDSLNVTVATSIALHHWRR